MPCAWSAAFIDGPVQVGITAPRAYDEGVSDGDIQVVSNEAGEPTAVIVPIALWREIASKRETAYLLKSETMRQRLQAALDRGTGAGLDDVVAKLEL